MIFKVQNLQGESYLKDTNGEGDTTYSTCIYKMQRNYSFHLWTVV